MVRETTVSRLSVKNSEQNLFQFPFPLQPIWHQLFQELVKLRSVIFVLKMAKFVDHDILDAIFWRTDEVSIKNEESRRRQTAPAGVHILHC